MDVGLFMVSKPLMPLKEGGVIIPRAILGGMMLSGILTFVALATAATRAIALEKRAEDF